MKITIPTRFDKIFPPKYLLGCSLFLTVLILYWQVAFFDFVNLDDWAYVKDCEWLRNGFTWPTICRAFAEYNDTGCWFPLTRLSYVLDISLFGLKPGAMHIHNALLHAANAVLVFIFNLSILKGLGNRNQVSAHDLETAESAHSKEDFYTGAGYLWAAAIAAAFWALHPLRVESVAWIASRKDVLSLFWELLALIFWVRGVHTKKINNVDILGNRWSGWLSSDAYWVLSTGCFVIACLAKPMAISFVFLVGLLDIFINGKPQWKRLAIIAVLTVPLIEHSIFTQKSVAENVNDPYALPLYGRLLNTISALGLYLKTTVWPDRLMTPYMPRWPLMPEFFWPSFLCLLAIGGIALYCIVHVFRPNTGGIGRFHTTLQGYPIPVSEQMCAWFVLGMAGFIISVLPTLGIVAFGYQARADRFTYLPSIWLSVTIAGALDILLKKYNPRVLRKTILGICVLVLATCSIKTHLQTQYWHDTEALSRRALSIEANNLIAHKNLATFLFIKRKNLNEACAHFQRATEIYPHPLFYVLAMTIMVDSGEIEQAREIAALFIGKIKEKEADGWDIHYKIAYAYYAFCTGDKDLAQERFLQLAENNPRYVPVQYMLGRLAKDRGDQEGVKKYWGAAAQDPLFKGWLKVE